MKTTFATELGKEFAAQLNAAPREAQNWSALDRDSTIPDGDYAELRRHFGLESLEHADINAVENAYKAGFNSVFVTIGKGE